MRGEKICSEMNQIREPSPRAGSESVARKRQERECLLPHQKTILDGSYLTAINW